MAGKAMAPGPTVDVGVLWAHVEAHREARERFMRERFTWEAVAGEVGVRPSALTRLKEGMTPSTPTLVRLMLWMGITDITRFVRGGTW